MTTAPKREPIRSREWLLEKIEWSSSVPTPNDVFFVAGHKFRADRLPNNVYTIRETNEKLPPWLDRLVIAGSTETVLDYLESMQL